MTVRINPRVSVNKLGEYLTCTAARRRRIIEDAKRPKDFIVPRYNEFYQVAPDYLASLDNEVLVRAIDQIESRAVGSEWDEQNKRLNADALANLPDIVQLLPDGLTLRPLPASQEELVLGDVAVSVRPEILITATVRGREVMGALKLYLSKSLPLGRDAAEYVATTVHQHLAAHPPTDRDIDHRLCLVADVPACTLFAAPSAYTRRRADILAACEEIAARWPAL